MTDHAPGSLFAGYRIDELAGRGGMGVVYRATDVALERQVALKLIAPELAGNAGFRRRFEAESKTAASLDHPNVVPILAAGEHDGVLFLVMRYVEGDDLRGEIEAHAPLPPERVVRIVDGVGSALDAAHAAGLVHRDVKPANILLGAGDHAYLMDFGLTKRLIADADETRTGHLLGTLNYVAPEQIRGAPVDARTDIYALGCVLFHMLTGTIPFPAEEQEAKLWAHISEPPPPASTTPGVPAGFDAVIARAMAKEPADRFATAGELAAAATAAANPSPAPAAAAHGATAEQPVPASRPPSAAPPLPTPPPLSRRDYGWALTRTALTAPFSLAVLGATLLAGLLFDLFPQILALALVAYAVAAWVTLRDDELQREVLERERRRRGLDAPPEDPRAIPGPSQDGAAASRIVTLLDQAEGKAARIREAIERGDLPYAEVSTEVDRLLATMRETARRAALLDDELREVPPDSIAARLEELGAENDPAKAELVEALEHQLSAQRKMESQLDRFYDRMEGMLIEFDTVRGHVIAASASTGASDQRRIAGELRDLRQEVGAVADGMSAAYAEQPLVGEMEDA